MRAMIFILIYYHEYLFTGSPCNNFAKFSIKILSQVQFISISNEQTELALFSITPASHPLINKINQSFICNP